MSKIEYGVESSNVFKMHDGPFVWDSRTAFLTVNDCTEPMALVVERATFKACDSMGFWLLNDPAGTFARVYVNDWCKVIDGDGREHTIGHGAYPADEFNRMVLRLSRARSEYDWKP